MLHDRVDDTRPLRAWCEPVNPTARTAPSKGLRQQRGAPAPAAIAAHPSHAACAGGHRPWLPDQRSSRCRSRCLPSGHCVATCDRSSVCPRVIPRHVLASRCADPACQTFPILPPKYSSKGCWPLAGDEAQLGHADTACHSVGPGITRPSDLPTLAAAPALAGAAALHAAASGTDRK